MAHSTHLGMGKRIVSKVAAVPVGFILGSLEGLARTPLYVLDQISRAIQGVTTGLIFKRVVAFCPSEREYDWYKKGGYEEDMPLGAGSFDRVFKICPIKYQARFVPLLRSIEGIAYVALSPLTMLFNMVCRGAHRVETFYDIFSGQYDSSNGEEKTPLNTAGTLSANNNTPKRQTQTPRPERVKPLTQKDSPTERVPFDLITK